jgi:hypothetical protein
MADVISQTASVRVTGSAQALVERIDIVERFHDNRHIGLCANVARIGAWGKQAPSSGSSPPARTCSCVPSLHPLKQWSLRGSRGGSTFGVGEYFCVGAHVARVELQTVFRHLLARLDSFEVSGPVERLTSAVNGASSAFHCATA